MSDVSVSLPIVTFILVAALVVFLVFLILKQKTQNSEALCPAGQCPTNLYSGIKTCPSNKTDMLQYNPAFEVCNPPNLCTSNLTPFAVQTDFSAVSGLGCPNNSTCNCVTKAQCPNYILSYFVADNGNPAQSLSGQRLIFNQQIEYTQANGVISNTPPLQLLDTSVEFCELSLPLVTRIAPIPCKDPSLTSNVVQCFSDNPCIRGQLAFVSTSTDINLNNTPVGCVNFSACPTGELLVFNPETGQGTCINPPS